MKKNTANNLGKRKALQVRLKIISYMRKNIEHIFEKFSADQATDVTIYCIYIMKICIYHKCRTRCQANR